MTCVLHLRPRKAFVTAWIACGYFNKEHFAEAAVDIDMDCQQAQTMLDETGMLKSIGLASDLLSMSPPSVMRCT